MGDHAWNSLGSKYDDWYDGAPATSRLLPRVNHSHM